MGLMGLGGTPWKDPDPQRRRSAVAALDDQQQAQLQEVAVEDPEADIRRLAIARLVDLEVLLSLVAGEDADNAAAAGERLTTLAEAAIRGADPATAVQLVDYVGDPVILADLSLREGVPGLRRAAVGRLVVLPATTPAQLATVAIRDAVGDAGLVAVEALDRQGHLKDVQRKAKSPAVRQRAEERITAIEQTRGGPTLAERRQLCVAGLVACSDTLEPLAEVLERSDLETVEAWRLRGEALMVEHADLAEDPAVIKEAERFRRTRDHCRQRLATLPTPTAPKPAEVMASTPMTVEPPMAEPPTAEPRLVCAPLAPEVAAKVEIIMTDATTLAAGVPGRAAEERFRQLHKDLFALALPIGDRTSDRFKALHDAFKHRRKEHRQQVRTGQRDQMVVFETIATDAETLVAKLATVSMSAQAVSHAVKDLDRRWRTGPRLPAGMIAAVKERFTKARDAIAEKARTTAEADSWNRFARIPKAEGLIEEAKALTVGEDAAATFAALKTLQQHWKQLGSLPPDRYPALWESFKAEGDRVYAELRPWFESKDEERRCNGECKVALLEKLSAILAGIPEGQDISREALQRAQTLMDRWRGIGPVPQADHEALQQRFRLLRSGLSRQRRLQHRQVKAELQDNLARKQVLLAELEKLAETVDLWKRGKLPGRQEEKWLRQLRDAQQSWSSIGSVPREEEAFVLRYREVCDGIYAAFEDYLKKQRDAEEENLRQKQELLKEFAEYLEEEHPRWFKEQILDLRRRWRDIGHVPRKNHRGVQEHWQDLCKRFDRL